MSEAIPNQKPSTVRVIVRCILFTLLLFGASILAGIVHLLLLNVTQLQTLSVVLGLFAGLAVLVLFYVLFRKKLVPALIVINAVILGILTAAVTVLMIVGKGNVDGRIIKTGSEIISLFFPGFFLLQFLQGGCELAMLSAVVYMLTALLLSILLQKKFTVFKKAWVYFLALLLCLGVSAGFYVNRPSVRYAGHGFDYMHGFSSTDFKDYMVYSNPSKLVTLDRPASLTIEGAENMPKMDGAEACYPVYAAVAKAVYKDIDVIEEEAARDSGRDQSANGATVRFTNTVNAFMRMIYPNPNGSFDVDLFFGARPSKLQLSTAEQEKIALRITPIGKEAFVFFVEEDNPVTNLTSEQIRKIYHGDITNWAEVGGKNQPIVAFQRPANSGSQTMMEYFMGDVSLKEPISYEYVDSMAGITQKVAQYANEAGAFGYSFRYFVEDLNQEKGVRCIAVDGVLPTIENIKNGSYPLTTGLCLITRENDPNPNVQKMIDFMLSDEGQELIEKTGYAGIR